MQEFALLLSLCWHFLHDRRGSAKRKVSTLKKNGGGYGGVMTYIHSCARYDAPEFNLVLAGSSRRWQSW